MEEKPTNGKQQMEEKTTKRRENNKYKRN